jgi:limonene-1,2-epoxide hydrolase
MATLAEESRSTVERFVNALVANRFDDARGLLHDELVVYEAGGVPFSGEYHGPQGFFDLFEEINKNLELTLDPSVQYLVADGTVVMCSRMKFTARGSGKGVEIGLVEIYTVRDALIVELDVYYKDPSAVAALLVP